MSDGETITVDLGEFGPRVHERVRSGEYRSASEVVQAGLEALEREEAEAELSNDTLRRLIQESLDDPRPDIPADEVFERLERKHATLTAAGKVDP